MGGPPSSSSAVTAASFEGQLYGAAWVWGITSLAVAEGAPKPSDEDLKKFTDECVADLDKKKEKIGEDKYKEQVKCVMAAEKMDALAKCDKGEEEKKAEAKKEERKELPKTGGRHS